ncbi:MAG: hypothetical protein U9Q33_10785 [Campylobacterota bacterium]|nr:hypothetical protein [Campylobacterota bacterium]
MKNRLVKIMIIFTTALFFSACGGSGDDASFRDAGEKIEVIDCDANVSTIPDGYTSMYSGELLINETTDTVITTYHDIDGIKKVCTVSGSAYLIRD